MSLRGKIITIPAVLSLIAIGLTGCGANVGEKTAAGQTPHETEGKLVVLTIFAVLQDMAKSVAGDHFDVRSITRSGAEIHDYQPTPSDLESAKDAKLILNNGLGLRCRLEKFTVNLGAKTVNVPEEVEPVPIAGGDYEDEPNPHTWMSSKSGALYVHNIAKAFRGLDVTNCDDYKANTDKYAADTEKVGEDINTTLSSLGPKQRTLISCEGASLYLTHDYNLNGEYLWGVNAEGALILLRVVKVGNYAKRSEVPTAFRESTVGEKMKPIVESIDVKFDDELYVDSLPKADGNVSTHLDSLKYDAKLITDGLAGK